MTEDRLAQIRGRLEAATRGPWRWDGHRVPTLIGRAGDPDIYEYDTEVIEATHGGECGCRSACTLDLEVGPRDAEFIANTPADVAYLLGRLAEAQATNTRLNQRATKADAFVEKATEDLRAGGHSLGRALANASADLYYRRCQELEARLAEATNQRDLGIGIRATTAQGDGCSVASSAATPCRRRRGHKGKHKDASGRTWA